MRERIFFRETQMREKKGEEGDLQHKGGWWGGRGCEGKPTNSGSSEGKAKGSETQNQRLKTQ